MIEQTINVKQMDIGIARWGFLLSSPGRKRSDVSQRFVGMNFYQSLPLDRNPRRHRNMLLLRPRFLRCQTGKSLLCQYALYYSSDFGPKDQSISHIESPVENSFVGDYFRRRNIPIVSIDLCQTDENDDGDHGEIDKGENIIQHGRFFDPNHQEDWGKYSSVIRIWPEDSLPVIAKQRLMAKRSA